MATIGIEGDAFNPAIPDEDGATPPWEEVIRLAIDGALRSVHTWQPASVAFIRGPNRVDLQPMILRKFSALPAPTPLPLIHDCMVVTPRGKNYGMKLPVALGDTGIALFCERSLDVWSASAGVSPVDPMDTRHHSLSDAVFIPGLFPFSQPMPPSVGGNQTDLILYSGAAQLFLQPGGGFKATNGAPGVELLSLLLQITQQLQTVALKLGTTTTQTLLGPEPLSEAANFTAAAGTLNALITKLTSLVGV